MAKRSKKTSRYVLGYMRALAAKKDLNVADYISSSSDSE
jgi:hypothetical protein